MQNALTFNNLRFDNFSVERKCVNSGLSDNREDFNYKLAFVNLFETPDAYTLSVVWTTYPTASPAYQRIVWSANRSKPVLVSSLLKTCHSPVTLGLSFNGEVLLSNSSLSNTGPVTGQNCTSQALCSLPSNYSIIKTNSYPNKTNTKCVGIESDGNLMTWKPAA